MASLRRLYASREQEDAARLERAARAADPSLPLLVRPSGRWQVRYRDAGGHQRSTAFDTEREAKRHKARVETQLADGEWLDPSFGEVRFGEWLDLWVRSRVVARTTAAAEESIVRRHLRPAFGALPIRSITKLRVQTWIAELEQAGLAPASIAKCYRLLGTAMRAAVDEQLLRQSPCRNITLPRGEPDERVFLSLEQVEVLLAEIPDRYRALIVVAYLTGLRWSELAGLRVHRLDLLRSRLEVAEVAQEAKGRVTFSAPKSKASRRVVSLDPSAVQALAAHLAAYPAGRDDLVFTSVRGMVLSRTRFAKRVFRPAVHRAAHEDQGNRLEGWERLPTFHSLRHSHVASLIADGVPLIGVQHRIGHGSIRVTYDTYGHLEDSVDEQLLAGLHKRGKRLMPPASGTA